MRSGACRAGKRPSPQAAPPTSPPPPQVGDPRLRARALSLVKVLAKQEQLELGAAWYAGAQG